MAIREKSKPRGKNHPHFDVRTHLYEKVGVDITRIDGINDSTALIFLSEIGFNVKAWKTEKQFSSWLGVSPSNKISGGKVLTTKTKLCANRAAMALRLATVNLNRSQTALGAFHRRMIAKLGKPMAVTATAHKLARLIYSMLKNGTNYVDQGLLYYEKKYKEKVIKNLQRKAKSLGYCLIEISKINEKNNPVLSTT